MAVVDFARVDLPVTEYNYRRLIATTVRAIFFCTYIKVKLPAQILAEKFDSKCDRFGSFLPISACSIKF